ncbi:hypothetical protein CRE_20008 [Caenorhabditis remanei]|uniref:Acyl_transf_3 domain-containing protein n=1 Tax=Caenorhabditis remanei TaxID=31234 RepID=E3NCG5_CAERE|nr:hypothetical protein CRE_20008 [Caenorhabditis remanei]
MTAASKPTKTKRNDLQGIRGFAILSVLGFHFYPNLFPNGYLGVDQFFVLSGFLMCMLLTKSQKLPIFQIFSEFYIRRFKRILPLYFLFILCTMFALYTVFPDTAIFQNQASAGKALLFVSNRPHTGDEDYFEKLSIAMDLFTHTWSLSVEIQFYIFVPLIFLIGVQFKGSMRYGYYTTLVTLSFILYLFSPPTVSFNSVFARIWQFLIGMMTYFISRSRFVQHEKSIRRPDESEKSAEDKVRLMEENQDLTNETVDKTANLVTKFIILALMISVVLLPKELDPVSARFEFIASIYIITLSRAFFTFFTGVLIVLSVEDVILNSRVMIYLGDISYSLYLIHWPVYAYVKLIYKSNFWILTGALLVSILLAVVVYEFFEKWYLKQSNAVITVLILVLFLSNVFYINKDTIQKSMEKKEEIALTPKRKYPRLDEMRDNMTLDDAERMNAYWNKHDHMGPELQEPNGVRRHPDHKWFDFQENGIEFKILLTGSSYVKNHHKLIIQECKHRATSISIDEVTGCEPLAAPHKKIDNGKFDASWAAGCPAQLPEFVDFVNTTQPDYAFILTRWFAVGEPYDTNENDLEHDSIYIEMKSQLRKILPNIKRKLFILDSFPRTNVDNIKNIARQMKEGKKTMEEINKSLYNPTSFERGRRRHAELVKKECGSKCELIDYVDAFWNKTMNAFQYFDNQGFSYFTSGSHLSAHGLEHVRPIYKKICESL